MIVKVLLLTGLIWVLLLTGKPFLCSGIYAGVTFLFRLLLGESFGKVLLSTLLVFVCASVYFWLLDYMESSNFAWWAVALGGLAIGLV